jgi:hypothetical protein
MQTTIKCKMCLVNTPVHLTEQLHNNGKRITVCQYCITDDENDLARRFARISGVDYNRLINVN